jgi:hypothetical protein
MRREAFTENVLRSGTTHCAVIGAGLQAQVTDKYHWFFSGFIETAG